MILKVKDKVVIINSDGVPYANGIIVNINEFREPSFEYAVDVIGYDEDVLFFGEWELVKNEV